MVTQKYLCVVGLFVRVLKRGEDLQFDINWELFKGGGATGEYTNTQTGSASEVSKSQKYFEESVEASDLPKNSAERKEKE